MSFAPAFTPDPRHAEHLAHAALRISTGSGDFELTPCLINQVRNNAAGTYSGGEAWAVAWLGAGGDNEIGAVAAPTAESVQAAFNAWIDACE